MRNEINAVKVTGSRGAWSAPKLEKLGTLRDVYGPAGMGSEGGPNGKS